MAIYLDEDGRYRNDGGDNAPGAEQAYQPPQYGIQDPSVQAAQQQADIASLMQRETLNAQNLLTAAPGTRTTASGQPDAPGAATSAKGTITDPAAFMQAWMAWPGNDMKAFVAANPQFAAEVFGSKGDKVRIGGRVYDAVIGAGTGAGQKAWNDITDGVSDLGDELGGFGIDPSYLNPWTQQFAAPVDAQLPTMEDYPDFSYQDFEGFDKFNAPTAESIYADPSYQFRMDQGRKAIENAASAKGLTNSGGTLRDILEYGQKFGSQEYGNVWNRDFGVWDTNQNRKLQTYQTNRNNAADSFSTNYGLSKDQYNANTDRANTSYNRAWQSYADQRDNFYKNQSNPFEKLQSLYGLGATAASA